ncbi:hypothetical protein [Mucilaginibacter glaciei]|uniref:Uncharacterized protein n=1 Tax=Mucilaginibacter glaciei TaxID=2772109 RepID=A0A926S4K6_9SPHI|nr:hypothetical protein [Mucilaginibacter glaciei]MBD1391871.1 hypothetical protein [Mucilaginibacter glaciei]
MRQILVVAILVLVTATKLSAQHKAYFEPSLAKTKTKNSLYNSIKLIDSRTDTTLGFVQTGAFNRRAVVVTKQPLENILSSIFYSAVDSDAGSGKLLLHLRQFNFAELTAGMSESGYLAFQADLYSQINDQFKLIGAIDTLFQLRSSIDVTNPLLKKGSDTLAGFIQSHLTKNTVNELTYSYSDVVHIDSIEKKSIKLYNTKTYTDGLYLTYKSFKDQKADKDLTVSGAYLYPGNVKALDENGKLKEVKLNKSYAVVYKGEPYIVTSYGFYPLQKNSNNDFTFTGKARVSAGAGTMIASSMFGVLGALITSGGDDATFLMKIDHRNGSIIRLKEIVEAKPISVPSKVDSW